MKDKTTNWCIDIHNEYSPSWSLEKTKEIVWKLKSRCISDNQIRQWFNQSASEESPEIIVDSMPAQFSRDDWR
jgi:hypothetical protein